MPDSPLALYVIDDMDRNTSLMKTGRNKFLSYVMSYRSLNLCHVTKLCRVRVGVDDIWAPKSTALISGLSTGMWELSGLPQHDNYAT